jgi:hypothetical protein
MAYGRSQEDKELNKAAEDKAHTFFYAPGQFYDDRTSVLGGTWEDLYNSTGELTNTKTGAKSKVNVDQSMINLTAEQQLAIKNNKNFKETQKRLQSSGVSSQQSVLGGGGY